MRQTVSIPNYSSSEYIINDALESHVLRNAYSITQYGIINDTYLGALRVLEKTFGDSTERRSASGYLVCRYDDGEFMVSISIPSAKSLEVTSRSFSVQMWGQYDRIVDACALLKAQFPEKKSQHVNWAFMTMDGKVSNATMELTHGDPLKDEAYPWFNEGPSAFQKAYLASTANVLLLIGEPGCGKTTFVRDLIRSNDLSTTITHDVNLMSSDQFFIEFLTGNSNLLVIEDADTILSSRDRGNTVMSKLLNASDGLIRTKKKIVMTANLTQPSQIDEALMRPGRCFDTVVFRPLLAPEASAAAAAYGIADPGRSLKLGELFNVKCHDVVQRMGFAA